MGKGQGRSRLLGKTEIEEEVETAAGHSKRGRKKKGDLIVQATRLTTQPAGFFVSFCLFFC
jgi:hypothetical protein